METEATSQKGGAVIGFLLKTVIVCLAIVITGVVILERLDDFVNQRIQQFEHSVREATSSFTIGGQRFWAKLEGELDRLADPKSDFSPEKKQKILSQIKVISDRWRPFVNEAKSVFEGENKKEAENR